VTGFEPEGLLTILVDEGVDFVIIGGYAAVLHGASRPTEDVDVTPGTTTENLTRLTIAVNGCTHVFALRGAPDGLPFNTSAEAMRGLLMLNLTTDFGDLDVTFQPSGTTGYEDLIINAEERHLDGITIRIASLSDVVRSKEEAGRDKDIRALTELYDLLHRSDPAGR
jgi:hypothetical protein